MYEAYFELWIMQSCSSRLRNKNMELGMSRMGELVSFNVECFIYTVKYRLNKITFELSPFQQWCQRSGCSQRFEISSSVSEPAASPSTPSAPSSHHSPRRCHGGIRADFIYYGRAWFMEAEAAQGKQTLWHFLPCLYAGQQLQKDKAAAAWQLW